MRRSSFAKATLAKSLPTRSAESAGLSQEHKEQGQVKRHVYKEYIKAASRMGFLAFMFALISQQGMVMLQNLTLRSWAEHNREIGSNADMMKYLVLYGLLSLSATLLGGIAAIIMWVQCSLRSARRLHDAVSLVILSLTTLLSVNSLQDAGFPYARAIEFL